MSQRQGNPEQPAAENDAGLNDWSRPVTHWLLHRAARSAPADLADRLEEEWRADLAARPSAPSRLRFALGCCWATIAIAREHAAASIPVIAAVAMPKTFDGVRDEPASVTRRSITFFVVAGLHVVLFYALLSGLAFRILKEIPTPFQAQFLPAPHTHPVVPPPPPVLAKSRIDIPPTPFPPIERENPDEKGDLVGEVSDKPVVRSETPPSIPPHEVIRVSGGPGIGFPATDDYYPPIAKRLEEQGVSTVRVCVGADGRLTSSPVITQSSGNSRLDDGALLLAKAGSGHYRSGTEDGRAVNSCFAFRVRFSLRTAG